MKSIWLLIVFACSCLVAWSEIPKEEMERLQRMVRIDSVRDSTERNDDREKVEVLKFNTMQDERDTDGFRIRVTVQLEDKDDNLYCAQLMCSQNISGGYEYTGQDRWEFRIPHGDLNRPDIKAYVIEYGIMDGETFVPLAVEVDGAKTREEISEGCQILDEEKISLWNAFVYRKDDGSGQQEVDSILRKLRK